MYNAFAGLRLSPEKISALPRYGHQKNEESDKLFETPTQAKELVIMGLHLQSNTVPLGHIRVPVIDVFGYTEHGESITVRIRGMDPEYLCKVPAGCNPDEFASNVLKELNNEHIKVEVRYMIDGQYFNFERKVPFIAISSPDIMIIDKTKETVLELYKSTRDTVELNNPTDELHHELEGYPLRFSETVRLEKYPYHVMMRTGLSLVGHFIIKSFSVDDNYMGITKSKRFVRVHYADIRQAPDSVSLFRHGVSMCFDLETDNLTPAKHVISDPRSDPIITIGASFYRLLDKEPFLNVAMYYKKKPSCILEDILLIPCEDEKEMLITFAKLCDILNVDVMLSFNGDMFDNSYIWMRANIHGVHNDAGIIMSRYVNPWKNTKVSFSYKEKYKADGFIKDGLSRFKTAQRSSFDARLYFQGKKPKEFGEKGKLSDMLLYFKVKDPDTKEKMHKQDLSIERMYQLWREADKYSLSIPIEQRHALQDGVGEILKYCVQDCKCTHALILETGVYAELFERAIPSYTTLNDSMHLADGLRVTRTVAKYAHGLGIALMDEAPPEEFLREVAERIGGGEVKAIRPGHVRFVTSMDFASQYPAQKEAKNVDTSSKVPRRVMSSPEVYGIMVIEKRDITDCYGTREQWTVKINNKQYIIEQFWAEGARGDRKTYYVQSRRDAKGNIIDHYSIKALMLTYLRACRKAVKKELSKVKKEMDELLKLAPLCKECTALYDNLRNETQRLDGKQNGIKLIMNSEYGINNSILYGLFDPDTAATVTWCGRQLIKFLRKCLYAPMLIIPAELAEKDTFRKDIDEFNKRVPTAPMRLEKVELQGMLDLPDMMDADGQVLVDKLTMVRDWPNTTGWYAIRSPPGDVIYQDTDSNYYTNPSIDKAFEHVTDIDQRTLLTMRGLTQHNKIMRQVVETIINRTPIGLGFEGAFTIAYYWPQKKRYIGIKCEEDPKEIKDVITSVNFDGYVPGTDIGEFLKERHVKVTGADIIRRDTPHFVIRSLFKFLQDLLSPIPPASLKANAERILGDFIDHFEEIDINELSRQQKYKPGKQNDVTAIIERLKSESLALRQEADALAAQAGGADSAATIQQQVDALLQRSKAKDALIPTHFQSIRYVVAKPSNQRKDAHGVVNDSVRPRMRLVEELESMRDVDVSYYYLKLARPLATFLFDEMKPSAYRRILDMKDDTAKAEAIRGLRIEIGDILQSAHFAVKGHTKVAKLAYNKLSTQVINHIAVHPKHAKTLKGLFDVMATIDTSLDVTVKMYLNAMKKKIAGRETIYYREFKEGISNNRRALKGMEQTWAENVDKLEHVYCVRYLNILGKVSDVDDNLRAVVLDRRRTGVSDGLLFDDIDRIKGNVSISEIEISELMQSKSTFEQAYRELAAIRAKINEINDKISEARSKTRAHGQERSVAPQDY